MKTTQHDIKKNRLEVDENVKVFFIEFFKHFTYLPNALKMLENDFALKTS